jgi:hypothetical protein
MSYTASCAVVLTDGDVHAVEAEGATRNEALINLGYAAMGINVLGVIPASIETRRSN